MQNFHLAEVSSGHGELLAPWGFAVPPERVARFYFVVWGNCWLSDAEGEWLELGAGDVVFLPRAESPAIASSPSSALTPFEKSPIFRGESADEAPAGTGSTQKTMLFWCSVLFDEPTLHPLLSLMPPLIHLKAAAANDPTLHPLLAMLAIEAQTRRMGAATVMSRLADVAITRMIRAWAEQEGSDKRGWLAAIKDPSIGRALAAMHRNPGGDWSVSDLAGIAGVSRSGFSARFNALMGIPPGQYATRLKMQAATDLLSRDRLTVSKVAESLGYESEASFSRAFKRHTGAAPSTVRRR